EISHAAENRLREFLPDHRCRLKYPLLPLGQAVDPRREDALHGRGNVVALCRLDQTVRTSASRDNACLDQRLHDLLAEEGIATRALLDELAESVKRRISAEEIGEELRGRFGAQRQERELLIVGPLHPLRVV